MGNQEAFDLIEDLFKKLEAISSIKELELLTRKNGLNDRINSFYEKYPLFDFSLTLEEINQLKSTNILTSEHKLDPENFPDIPLAKLLAAVLWKNGDIHKVQHLVDGITGREGDRTPYSLVFKQYGASLESDSEPIVDQHVLRAFEIYSLTENSETVIEKIRKKSVYKSRDKPLLDRYREWFNIVIEKVSETDKLAFKENLDKVLFLIGKSVKL